MKFALFYEIPVAQPWDDDSEYTAYHDVIEQAVAADRLGFHAFWTVEHHFLDEYSHCSNPEVLYGAVAARTSNLRLGYGVRLMPDGYRHPVRTAESTAVLDLISDGRVDVGTGRSSTRLEMEGFGIDPYTTRDSWREAIEFTVGAWTNDVFSFDGEFFSMPERRVHPKPRQKPHPPLWGATGDAKNHYTVGELGLGLCSFAVATDPANVKERIDAYRAGIANCTEPIGHFVNNQASTFTMVNVAPTAAEAREVAEESFLWYPRRAVELVASVPAWMMEMDARREGDDRGLGSYEYLESAMETVSQGLLDHLSMDYLIDSNACLCGDPETALAQAKAYEAAGVDLLLCLVNPYKIPHDKVMQTIELMGAEVIPAFD